MFSQHQFSMYNIRRPCPPGPLGSLGWHPYLDEASFWLPELVFHDSPLSTKKAQVYLRGPECISEGIGWRRECERKLGQVFDLKVLPRRFHLTLDSAWVPVTIPVTPVTAQGALAPDPEF